MSRRCLPGLPSAVPPCALSERSCSANIWREIDKTTGSGVRASSGPAQAPCALLPSPRGAPSSVSIASRRQRAGSYRGFWQSTASGGRPFKSAETFKLLRFPAGCPRPLVGARRVLSQLLPFFVSADCRRKLNAGKYHQLRAFGGLFNI